MDDQALIRILSAFERRGVKYAIFGAVALNLHGLARFTEDLDVFIAPEAANITAMRAALRDVYDDPEIETITVEDLLGDYPAIQYVPPDGQFHLDIVVRLGNTFTFSNLETQRVPFGTLMVTTVTPRMLYRMKRDTVRLKDKADAQLLKERFNIEEP